jgi:hypothetical protein
MLKVAPLAQRIIDGHQIVHDSHGPIGILSLDAQFAQEKLESEIDAFSTDPSNHLQIWGRKELAYVLDTINAQTTDELAQSIVSALEAQAAHQDAVIPFDLRAEIALRKRLDALAIEDQNLADAMAVYQLPDNQPNRGR